MSTETEKVVDDELDIVVEADAEAPADGDRLASDQRHEDDVQGLSEEEITARKARKREERQERKRRRRQYAEEDQILIKLVSEENVKLREQLQKLTGRVEQSETQQAEAAYNHWAREYRRAESEKARAIELGDGNAVVAAEQKMRQAYSYASHFRDVGEKAQSTLPPEASAPDSQGPAADPAIINHMNTFRENFPRYDFQGRDRDSQEVLKIDAALAAEGFDPRTKDYWEELEARVAEALPHWAEESEADAPRDEKGRFLPRNAAPAPQRQAPPPQPMRRGGPPTAGASEGRDMATGTKRTVTIPDALKRAMQDAGSWDDPVRRKKTIDNYLARQRAQNQ
jgi:predicted nucleic acid-binding protein